MGLSIINHPFGDTPIDGPPPNTYLTDMIWYLGVSENEGLITKDIWYESNFDQEKDDAAVIFRGQLPYTLQIEKSPAECTSLSEIDHPANWPFAKGSTCV